MKKNIKILILYFSYLTLLIAHNDNLKYFEKINDVAECEENYGIWTASANPEESGSCVPAPHFNHKLPNDVRWVTQSKEYIQLCEQVYDHATYVCKIKAQFYNSSTSFKAPAVVLDLDETVLDNSQYQVELFYNEESFNMESWSDWVLREEAELVPGSKDFIEFISSLNIQIIFISNRMDERLDATKSNMKKLGIYSDNDIFLLRLTKEDTKEIRRQEILNGTGRMEQYGKYDVMAYIGDAKGDFPDNPHTNLFILPNPMYGKW